MSSDGRQYFTEIDDCIMAAYKYVGKMGCKVFNYCDISDNNVPTSVGLKTDDGILFVMTWLAHVRSKQRKIADLAKKSNIKIPELINRQLLAFL